MPIVNKTETTIVIIANTLFYPARRNGVSIRYFSLIRELHRRGYVIDIIIINKYRENYNSSEIEGLNKFCKNIDIINPFRHSDNFFTKNLQRITNIAHLVIPFGLPYVLLDNNYKHSFTLIRDILKNRVKYDIGIGVGVGGCNADMLLSLDNTIRPSQVICDFIDSAYLLRKRLRKNFLSTLNPVSRLEDIKTRRWETSLCKRCDCIYISIKDAETTGPCMAHVVPNCITEDGYSDSHPINLETPNIAFLGNMAYPPNIEACIYLTDTLYPLLKKRIPNINLYIIGRNPSEELLQHCTDSHIHITGEVDNIWDYIRSVDIFVFPILSGAGLQNKVLEAMFANKVVVTSSIGNEGIDAIHGKHIYIANNPDEFIFYIEKSLCDKNHINLHARNFIDENFSTASITNQYEKILRDINR